MVRGFKTLGEMMSGFESDGGGITPGMGFASSGIIGGGMATGVGIATGGAAVGGILDDTLFWHNAVDDASAIDGVVIEADGSFFVIERESTEGVVVAFGGDCNISLTALPELGKEPFIVFGGGCNTFAIASLGLAGGPTGIAPINCKTFCWQ